MQAKEIITKKREGGENSKEELKFLLDGFLNGDIKEYQISAWLMAVYFQGMSKQELSHWTQLMWHSGLTLPRIKTQNKNTEYWIDKHSTGGIGDKTSLILVPLVSAVVEKYLKNKKVKIPMISGRGLGHTGGTLDKLESVSGFSTQIDLNLALRLLEEQGFFMIGQTKDIAPADRLIYALRDVTGTIESIPLIVSSIMSKKLSENLNGIVFDVKTGLGAFMSDFEKAKSLAHGLISVAKAQGLDAVALISQMDEPLGNKVGNFLEVEECADFLNGGQRDLKLESLTLETAAWMVHMASSKEIPLNETRQLCIDVLEKREAYSVFKNMFEAQGGDYKSFEAERESFRNEYLSFEFKAPQDGIVSQMHARMIGVLLVEIGGGRAVKEAVIDNKVGFEIFKKVGEAVAQGDTILKAYYKNPSQLEQIKSSLKRAIQVVSGNTEQSYKQAIIREIIVG